MRLFPGISFIGFLVFVLMGCSRMDESAIDNPSNVKLQSYQEKQEAHIEAAKLLGVSQQGGSVNHISAITGTGDTQGLSNGYQGHISNRPTKKQHKKPASNPRYIKIQLLGINDLHGQLNVTRKVNGKSVGRADYLATYLKRHTAENKNTLLVHVGDMVGASAPVSALLQDEPTVDFLNQLHFHIGTMGNHEFDEGINELLRLINGGTHAKTGNFGGAAFPWIVANVINEKTGSPIFPPYKVIEVNGIQIGFIGVCTTHTPNVVIPSGVNGIKFIDEAQAINRSVAALKKIGVRAIVVLAHNPGSSGFNGEQAVGRLTEIAHAVDEEVDIIYGGHNHAYMNAIVDGKLLVQSYSYGTAFSDVDLEIDPGTKNIMNKSAEIVNVFQEGIEPDAVTKRMIQQYEAKVEPIVNRLIGVAKVPLISLQNEDGESLLGNVIADSQRALMKTDFALMNPGGIRADVGAGDVTWGHLFTVQPFNNKLVKMNLTGEQIRAVLNQQWQGQKQTMLQISGFTYTWDDNQPIGKKVMDIQLPDGTSLAANKSYTVTVNSFLADGGDGFTILREGTDRETGPVDLDALVEFIKAQSQPFSFNIEEKRIHKLKY
jgi:5'-nucleotidase